MEEHSIKVRIIAEMQENLQQFLKIAKSTRIVFVQDGQGQVDDKGKESGRNGTSNDFVLKRLFFMR